MLMSRRRRDPFGDTIFAVLTAINRHPALVQRHIRSHLLTKADNAEMREMSDHVFDLMSIEFGSLGKSILLDLVKQRSGVSTHLSHSVIANCRTIFLTQAANCELAELVCAMVIQFTSSFVEIILLSTAEEHQRQGYGRSMVCLAAEIAKGVGNPRLVIDGIKSSEGFWSKPHLVSSTLMGLSPSVLTACWPQLGQDHHWIGFADRRGRTCDAGASHRGCGRCHLWARGDRLVYCCWPVHGTDNAENDRRPAI